MRGNSALLLVVLVSGAGCADSGSPTSAAGDDTNEAPTQADVELFNQTMRWPTLPSDQARWTFEVMPSVGNLTVDFNLWLDPPAGYGCCYMADPLRAALIGPSGERIMLFSFSAPHPAYHCVNLPDLEPCPLAQPPHLELRAEAGTWALELDGIMSADAWLRSVGSA
jgi:hypothetical protein